MPPAKVSASGQQHVQMFRKSLLRKRLLRHALPGAVYVPFIGDGDLAAIHYPHRPVFGADLDPSRVAIASSRLTGSRVIVEDCDIWPFTGCTEKFAVADFDAYADPYTSFRAFWREARRLDRLVLFFTDGLPQAVIRSGSHKHFDGNVDDLPDVASAGSRARSTVYNQYLPKFVWPAFEAHIHPYRVIDRMRYRRHHVIYWGAVIQK